MDVLILGGGAAGLSAAMALGRMGQTAFVCDDQRPRNAMAAHMNNFPSRDGMPPVQWREQVRSELTKYQTVSFFSGSVLSIVRQGDSFKAQLSDGSNREFKRVILAHGIEDQLPDISGLRSRWGKSVFHCPYCHGFEVRGTRLGLVANGPFLEHLAPMIYGLSSDLIIFTNGPAAIGPEIRSRLTKQNVRIDEGAIQALEGDSAESEITMVVAGSKTYLRDGIFWAPVLPFKLKSSLGVALGCDLTEFGLYKVDAMGKTSVRGVYAAGDVSSMMHSVLMAASSGQLAGAAIAGELLSEKF